MNTKSISLTVIGLIVAAASLHAYNVQSADTVPPNVPKNIDVTAAPGACVPLTIIDQPRLALRQNALALVNISFTENARASCAPTVRVSGNGTEEVGLWVGNNDGGQQIRTVTCVLWYNTAGLGPRSMTKSVMVDPNSITRMGFHTDEFVRFGGPVSITCNLPPRTSVMRVYTISQASS